MVKYMVRKVCVKRVFLKFSQISNSRPRYRKLAHGWNTSLASNSYLQLLIFCAEMWTRLYETPKTVRIAQYYAVVQWTASSGEHGFNRLCECNNIYIRIFNDLVVFQTI